MLLPTDADDESDGDEWVVLSDPELRFRFDDFWLSFFFFSAAVAAEAEPGGGANTIAVAGAIWMSVVVVVNVLSTPSWSTLLVDFL